MKLERLHEYVTIVVTIACGMGLALYVGRAAGSGSNTPLLIIGAILAGTLALILRSKVWILIPLCAPLTGKMAGMPGNLGIRHLAFFYAFVVYLALKALKVVRAKPVYDWLDYLLFINLAYLLVTYIRNPVGTLAMGFEKIGGKPYIEVIFTLLAYLVLNHVTVSPKMAMRLPFLMVLGHLFNTFAALVGTYLPSVGQRLSVLYSAFSKAPDYFATEAEGGGNTGEGLDRKSELAGSSLNGSYALCSYFPAPSLLNPLNIVRFVLAVVCFVSILKTGFRSLLLSAALFFFFSTYFRQGLAAAVRVPVLLLPALVFLVIGNGTMFNLPLNIQRTLSFLPGNWDPVAKGDGERSTEWRQEIWSNVWNSGNKYINNWWFGDGFGLTRTQLRESLMMARNDSQENLTIAGDYHSLPLSTIHVVGYVGLAMLIVFSLCMSIYAWKLVQRARGTPYFPLALLVGVPVIYEIFFGFFIFGAYKSTVYTNIYAVAWLRLVSRSLEAYLAETKAKENRPAALFGEPNPALLPRWITPQKSNT